MKIGLLTIFSFFLFIKSSQGQVTLEAFKVDNPYVFSGKVVVSNTSPSTVVVLFDIARGFAPTTGPNANPGGYSKGLMKYFVAYINGSTITPLTTEANIITSDYQGQQRLRKTINVTIPAGYVGGYVALRYQYFNDYTNVWDGYFSSSAFYTSLPYPGIFDGYFIHNLADNKMYVGLAQQLRHIWSPLTLNGLFAWNANLAVHRPNMNNLPIDAPLMQDNALVHHTVDDKIYFREGNLIRHISSEQVFNKYHFNWNSLHPTSTISSYVLGTPIY